MRPIPILTLIAVLALVLAAGVLARPDDRPRALPEGPIVSAPIDAAPDAAPTPGPTEDPSATGSAASGAAAFGPDPLAGALDLAVLPGRGQHSQSAYVAGSAASDLPLEEGVELVPFDDLLLPDYSPPAVIDEDGERDPRAGFPEEIVGLDGARIALEGFMQPLEFEGDLVKSFLLSPYPPGCCFGGMPGLDEYVEIEVAGDGVKYLAYRVIRVTGEFEVGELLDDWGYVASLYRMTTDKVEQLW